MSQIAQNAKSKFSLEKAAKRYVNQGFSVANT